MAVATSPDSHVRTAIEVPRWALDFYLRHFVLVAGISLAPAAERFVVVMWESQLPAAVPVVGEILTTAVRLLLLGVVVWLALYRDDTLKRMSRSEQGGHIRTFVRARWPSLIVQVLLIAGAVVVCGVIPERVITLWIPDDIESVYMAILLAVKNPTVLAFMFVWMVGIARQMMLHDQEPWQTTS